MDTVTLTLPPDVMANIKQYANSKGVTPDDLVTEWARKLISAVPKLEPQDDWERRLLSATSDAGVSLSDTIDEEKEPLSRPSFVEYKSDLVPQNEWEEAILNMGRPTGVSLSDAALTSDEIYD